MSKFFITIGKEMADSISVVSSSFPLSSAANAENLLHLRPTTPYGKAKTIINGLNKIIDIRHTDDHSKFMLNLLSIFNPCIM